MNTANKKMADIEEVMRISYNLCYKKNQKSMLRYIKEDVLSFLQFEKCGILFYSKEKDSLYVISLDNDDSFIHKKHLCEYKDLIVKNK